MYSPSDDMNILVDRIENTGISPGQVVALLHESFEERLQQGLRFTCSSMTEEQYRERTKDAWQALRLSISMRRKNPPTTNIWPSPRDTRDME